MRSGPGARNWDDLRSDVFEVFTPGQQINELSMFTGRQDAVRRLQDISNERGRHAIILVKEESGKHRWPPCFIRT